MRTRTYVTAMQSRADAGIGSIHDDKVGIDRIVEALNANMWSHMVMKEDRGSALEGAYGVCAVHCAYSGYRCHLVART